jgi:uracil-DNA glycosylase family protein
MLIGEQPGDQEDKQGEPFVGPAGKLLRGLLAEAKIEPEVVYLTNAVKHFKWTPGGKRRLHAKPTMREVNACKPWLIEEIEVIDPQVLVCLGATALQSLLGSQARLTKVLRERLRYLDRYPLIATYHPSAILRAPDDTRQEMRALLLKHLIRSRKLLHT